MRIFIPTAVLIVLLGAYWWFWQQAADEVREEVTEWVENERDAGRIADYESLEIVGFPYRLQIEITAPRLGDPALGWSWEAAKMTGFVLPYRLNHIIIVAEGAERLELARLGRYEVVTGTPMHHRASLIIRNGDLERFDHDLEGFALTRTIYHPDRPETPERVELVAGERLTLHTRRLRDEEGLPDRGHHHAAVVEATAITWTGHPYEGLGPDISTATARVILTGLPESGIGSINDEMLPGWHNNDGSFYLDELGIQWGEIEILANGEVRLDRRNRPRGRATVLIGGHDELIDAMVAGGAILPRYAELMKSALSVIAMLSGDEEGRIRAPLRMSDGKLLIGPVEIANLPPLYHDDDDDDDDEPEADE